MVKSGQTPAIDHRLLDMNGSDRGRLVHLSVVGEVAGVVGLLGVAGTVAALATLHVLPTGLSPLHNAVSQYGITRYRLGYRIATICTGLAGVFIAAGIQADVRGAGVVVVVLVVFGLARLAISWFPMDTPGTPVSASGRRHGLLAIVAFASVGIAALRLSDVLRRTHQWTDASGSIQVAGWLMLVAIIAMVVVRRGSGGSYFGAVERAFYVGMLAFLAIVSVALISH